MTRQKWCIVQQNRNLTELWGASVAFGANELYQTTSGAIKDELYVNEVKEEMKEIISEQIISSECGE